MGRWVDYGGNGEAGYGDEFGGYWVSGETVGCVDSEDCNAWIVLEDVCRFCLAILF